MALFLFIWIGIAVACSAIAGSKGRSAFGWLILGIFFGIFALIVVACISRKVNYLDTPKGMLDAGIAKKCPQCAEIVKREALVCRHCGYSFDPSAIPPEPTFGQRVGAWMRNN